MILLHNNYLNASLKCFNDNYQLVNIFLTSGSLVLVDDVHGKCPVYFSQLSGIQGGGHFANHLVSLGFPRHQAQIAGPGRFWLDVSKKREEGRKEMFYLTTHSTHFTYGYMASDIW